MVQVLVRPHAVVDDEPHQLAHPALRRVVDQERPVNSDCLLEVPLRVNGFVVLGIALVRESALARTT